MNLNLHNYEGFFILYWDNELTAAEKKQVEIFVQENADLQEEFRLFGETRFTPDPAVFFARKELLINEKDSFINFSNCTERLLSYIDDELTAAEKSSVEEFARKHSAIQQELSILLKTKLHPEAEIVFPDKSALYRREEKVKAIGIYWKRLAIAAAIILLAGFVTFRLINNNRKGGVPEITITNPPEEDKRNKIEIAVNKGQKLPGQKQPEIKKSKTPLPENPAVENIVAVKNEGNKNNLPKEKNNAEQPLIADISTTGETGISEMKKSNNNAVAITEPEKEKKFFSASTVTNTASPSLVIYNSDGATGKNENEDKGGLKGFLRKATRVFEHRTNIKTTTDDNKLLVGVFAVSLK